MPIFLLGLLNPFTAVINPVLKFWSLIPRPVKILIYLIVAAFIGFTYGRHIEIVKCRAQMMESINAAKQIDVKANTDSLNDLTAKEDAARKRALEFENKYNEVVAGYVTLKQECTDAQFIEDNNKLNDDINADIGRRLSDKVPGSKPGLAPNSKRGPVTNELPKSPSK